jgi:hypothetical protein
MSETLGNVGLVGGYATGESGWGDAMNQNLRAIDALMQPVVFDKDLATPPASPAIGDAYIVGAAATSAWLGKESQITVYYSTGWGFYMPKRGWRVFVDDEGIDYRYTGAAWVALS